jgi:RNA polymerase sigma factor (sigma-70 family)
MQPISTEELVAYFAEKLPSDRARRIEDLSRSDAEFAARLWLIQATAGYCREDLNESPRSGLLENSSDPPALEAEIDTALASGNLERAQELAAAYRAGKGDSANREPGRELWSRAGYVPALMKRIKAGDRSAAEQLLARYVRRLHGLARAKLRGKRTGAADEEDVVQSALAGFFLGAERGQYTQLHDRDDLWNLLVKITIRNAQKLVREQEGQKRHSGRRSRATPPPGSADTLLSLPGVEQIADPNPPPDLQVLANETIERLVGGLGNARLKSIAMWKWEGYSNEEIASMLGCSSRTVLRKLKLIRTIWSQEEQSGTSQAG